MNALLLPPSLHFRFPSLHFCRRILRREKPFEPPVFAAALSITTASSARQFSLGSEPQEAEGYDVASLPNRNYDFTPLIEFLSAAYTPTDSDAESSSPTRLDPAELKLAESYRAVPAPLWHNLLKSLSSTPDSFPTAYALVTWLQKHNLCFSYELLYAILIHALGRSEKLYEAFLLSQRQTLTPLTYNALIGACARNNDIEKALNLLTKMRRDGYHPDFVNYSLIIQSLTRSNSVDSAMLEKLYAEIEADMIELDMQLLNDITVAFAKAGNVDRALDFLGMIQGNGMSLKRATITAIISGLGHSGRTEEAEAVFVELKEGYAKAGCLNDAEDVVSEMKRSGVAPDEYTYSLLIDACANAGSWESAEIVLKEMEANGLQPNSFIFSRILASYRDRGEWQKSFEVLKEMKSCGVKADRHFYNVMIDTFGKYNCLEQAMDAFERMKVEGVEPDNVTWNTLIDCHCKHGHHNTAEELFEAMQKSGRSPCTTTYNIMINSFGQQERWEGVKDLLGKMQSHGVLPNEYEGRWSEAQYLALNSLINAFGEDRRDAEAFAVLRYMKENDLKPDVVTYTTLMKALIRVEKFGKVPAVYEEMLTSGCKPDRKARAMLRSALRYMKSTLKL
nr:pentatricopeptide repeat-containing protein At5g42310, mitochondrial [Ipomoea batatas]